VGTITIPVGATAPVPPFCVFDCAVTRILGFYPTREAAEAAAQDFGGVSFPYELPEQDRAVIDAACTPVRQETHR
jgi:hypothetical protein